jgi:hypothetical protein
VIVCFYVLTPLAAGGFLPSIILLEHQSCPCALSLYVCNTHSSIVTQYSFILFPQLLKRTKKKSNIPQKEEGKSIFFIGNIMSRPWIKHICLFAHQTMGCSTTLGSFSRYIELCSLPFGYSSKHMESLHCLLLRRLMINIHAV